MLHPSVGHLQLSRKSNFYMINKHLYISALVKSPTKSNEAYYPFGRPGGGAPIRDNRGRVRAHVAGIVENEKIVRFLLNS